MIQRVIIFLVPILMIFSFCEKEMLDPENSPEFTLIFGSYYGFCQENCTHLYKLENGKIYRDNMDYLDLEELVFERIALSIEHYIMAYPLIEEFPS